MADTHADFLLIGGFACGHAAAELRKQGADGSIVLVGREPDPPYERPPLTKEYLRAEAQREDAYVNEPSWYEANGIELRTGTNLMSLDADARTAKLQGGDEVGFDKALIATGANVNILRVDGANLDRIHYLRTLGNSDNIRADAERADRVVLVGGSYIACEVAASLKSKGTDCALVMMEEVALSRTFGEEAGRWFQDVLESKGVEFHGGETLAAFEGDDHASAVVTESGKTVEGDMVVIGAGVRPDVMVAQRAGLEIDEDDGGIRCDETLQTSVEGIYAAGDVCSYESPIHGRRIRVEHWDVAMQQGQHAARAMMGDAKPYEVVPYFFSDLADWASLEYVGPAYDWDEVVWRGDRDAGEFLAFYLKDGRVAGALSIERSEDLGHARTLLAEGVDVGSEEAKGKLADPDSDLAELTGS
ncbi:MAG TPA: FAD-dependent oxidoreductase [Solirubrobacterales bacterium]|jgi:3-phenylpropionate/trans-cinnamate dioxygenase ferredoxin reductase subunit|nr:FAD-dependent oxidoreductase [Solirubrobacterales bacterium]